MCIVIECFLRNDSASSGVAVAEAEKDITVDVEDLGCGEAAFDGVQEDSVVVDEGSVFRRFFSLRSLFDSDLSVVATSGMSSGRATSALSSTCSRFRFFFSDSPDATETALI